MSDTVTAKEPIDPKTTPLYEGEVVIWSRKFTIGGAIEGYYQIINDVLGNRIYERFLLIRKGNEEDRLVLDIAGRYITFEGKSRKLIILKKVVEAWAGNAQVKITQGRRSLWRGRRVTRVAAYIPNWRDYFRQ